MVTFYIFFYKNECFRRFFQNTFSIKGVDAASIKSAIDKVYSGEYGFDDKEYWLKLVAATADGASVNFWRFRGVLTQLSETRPWLLKIHCTNHRIELAVKDAMDEKYFKKAERFYRNN